MKSLRIHLLVAASMMWGVACIAGGTKVGNGSGASPSLGGSGGYGVGTGTLGTGGGSSISSAGSSMGGAPGVTTAVTTGVGGGTTSAVGGAGGSTAAATSTVSTGSGCPVGQTDCGGSCVDTNDGHHCGCTPCALGGSYCQAGDPNDVWYGHYYCDANNSCQFKDDGWCWPYHCDTNTNACRTTCVNNVYHEGCYPGSGYICESNNKCCYQGNLNQCK